MSQHYRQPNRAEDPYSLPDVETFRARYGDCPFCTSTVIEDGTGQFHCNECQDGRRAQGVTPADILTGWFFWSCFPGCLPDSDPSGPYTTEAQATQAAQNAASD